MKDTFSKADTMAVKGVAILFMLFAHLFNRLQLVDLSTPLAYVGEQPLVSLLIFAMSPVHFFIFLSGYGLSLFFESRRLFYFCMCFCFLFYK